MSATVIPLNTDPHQAVQTLLPWYVTGRLDRAEVKAVEGHLAHCAHCQAELAWERKMQDAQVALGDGGGDVEQGWLQLLRRIELRGHAEPPLASGPNRQGGKGRAAALWVRWLRWALGAQFAVIGVLATLLIWPIEPAERYRALGTPGHAASGNVVVRFHPEATERDIRRVLNAAGAKLVDGPTVTDAYLLNVPTAHQAAALAGLRAQPTVVLAESLDGGMPP